MHLIRVQCIERVSISVSNVNERASVQLTLIHAANFVTGFHETSNMQSVSRKTEYTLFFYVRNYSREK